MKTSYSSVSCFTDCPYLWKLKYIDHLKEKFDERPTNPLALGTAVHTGIETRNIDKAIEEYRSNYSVWGAANELECYKLKKAVTMAIQTIPEGEYEFKLDVKDEFIGYIDCLVKVGDNTYDLYDFKYSANVDGYSKSAQIHIYKHYFELLTDNKIRDIYYVFIPKCPVDLTNADPYTAVDDWFGSAEVVFKKIKFDKMQVEMYFRQKKEVDHATSYPKVYSYKCKWCCFRKYCLSNGADKSELKEKKSAPQGSVLKEVSLF